MRTSEYILRLSTVTETAYLLQPIKVELPQRRILVIRKTFERIHHLSPDDPVVERVKPPQRCKERADTQRGRGEPGPTVLVKAHLM